jgi:hypothetical protein
MPAAEERGQGMSGGGRRDDVDARRGSPSEDPSGKCDPKTHT